MVLSLLLFLFIIVAGVVVLVAIRNLKKRQTQNSQKIEQREAEDKQLPLGVKQGASQGLEEEGQCQLEVKSQSLEEKTQIQEEISHPISQEQRKERLPKAKRETNRLEPVKRGGRPRAPAQGSVRQPLQEARSRHRKSEVEDREHEHYFKVFLPEYRNESTIAVIPAEHPVGEKRSPLKLDRISAPRLASILARVRKETCGPLRTLIKEVHQEYYRGQPIEFIKRGLCIIAFILKLKSSEMEQHQIPGPKKRWAAKAYLARDEFPKIMAELQERYEKLKSAHRT